MVKDENTTWDGNMKALENVRKRLDERKISKLISYDELLFGNPSKERMTGRLEAYLQTGAVIDQNDLIRIVDEYNFSYTDCSHLTILSQRGIIEGLIQEPDNITNYGRRAGCFSSLAIKCFDLENDKNA